MMQRLSSRNGGHKGSSNIAHPEHTWRSLREAHPGRSEAELVSAPESADWVRLRLELEHPTLRVYVDGSTEPALVVEQLGEHRAGGVGLWVGNPSDGEYRRLRVQSGE